MRVEELKYGEEYYEKSHKSLVRFKMGLDGNLYWRINDENGIWEKEKAPLAQVLNYKFEEIEKQFPQIGDKYYVIGMIGGQHLSIVDFEWCDSKADRRMLRIGNVFETAEEARETEQRIINEILKNRKIS
mgnify:FL=1